MQCNEHNYITIILHIYNYIYQCCSIAANKFSTSISSSTYKKVFSLVLVLILNH